MAVSEERDTYERETARLQSSLQMEQSKRTEMAAHAKVTGLSYNLIANGQPNCNLITYRLCTGFDWPANDLNEIYASKSWLCTTV